MLTGQEEDVDVIKTEESEDDKDVPAESRSQTGNDAETQEVTGEEERPAGSSANSAGRTLVPEGEAEDDLGNRCVKKCVPLVPLTGYLVTNK